MQIVFESSCLCASNSHFRVRRILCCVGWSWKLHWNSRMKNRERIHPVWAQSSWKRRTFFVMQQQILTQVRQQHWCVQRATPTISIGGTSRVTRWIVFKWHVNLKFKTNFLVWLCNSQRAPFCEMANKATTYPLYSLTKIVPSVSDPLVGLLNEMFGACIWYLKNIPWNWIIIIDAIDTGCQC